MTARNRILIIGTALAVTLASLTIAVAASVTAIKPPANDDFDRAQIVAVSGVISGTTSGASTQPGEPGVRSGDRTVWYDWTPAQPGAAYVVATRPGEGVQVRGYIGNSLRRLRAVDVTAPRGRRILAAIDAFAGLTYRIQVDARRAGGRFALALVQPLAGRPANATAAGAVSLAQAVRAAVTGDRAAASLAGTTAGSRGAVYYRWTAPAATRGRLGIRLLTLERKGRAGIRLLGARRRGRELWIEARGGRTYTLTVRGGQAYFALQLQPARSFRLDVIPPAIACRVPHGWTRSNAAITCTARDSGSGLADLAQRRFKLKTGVPAGTATADAATQGVTVCDRAGNCATAGPFTGLKVDRTVPAVSCQPVTGTGWRYSVTVNCQASVPAGSSGLAMAADASFTLTATLAPGRASRHAPFASHRPICDLAGNCVAVPHLRAVAIDRVAPRIACGRRPAGWVRAAKIRCTATDRLVALASVGDASFTLSTGLGAGGSDARAYTSSHSVCDKLGNCATAGPIGPVELDREPPVLSCHVPAAWVRGRVGVVRCRAEDAGSGVAGARSFTLVAGVPAGTERQARSGKRRVCDRAGNCVVAGPFSLRLDDRPPAVACEPVPRGWQSAPVVVSCTATDAGSGVVRAEQTVLLEASVPRGTAGVVGFPRRRICDLAGNCALTPRLRLARIDRRAPAVSCTRAAAGRHLANVTIRCRASDRGGAGLAGTSSFALATSIPAGELSHDASTGSQVVCDRVGNCVTIGPFGPYFVDRRGRG